ncbi:MAG: tripartite tricarboxylate transporter substrate binding protein [Rhizobacter sp.]|nr:tripartite tricarboxylate transporter substrate binding protein [Burkholderiales bacterium]
MPRITLLNTVAATLLFTAIPLVASAQTASPYPIKPVRLMVGASAGGGTDIIARMLAEKFAASFKEAFVVENRPGASNTIAADLTAKAAPDGHTLLVATNTGQAIAPHLIKLSFDPIKDLTPIALIVTVPNVLVVNQQVGAKDAKELIAMMNAKPDRFTFASSGVGSTQHLAGEGFKLATGVKMTHVPYKGSSQAHLDLIAGSVQVMFDTTSSAMSQIKAGKLKALAVTTPKRAAELPDVPTLAEAGVPGFEMSTWYGLYATAGTPKDVVARLVDETNKILRLPDVQAKLRGLGGEPGGMNVEQFAALNKSEFERFGKLIREANVKID